MQNAQPGQQIASMIRTRIREAVAEQIGAEKATHVRNIRKVPAI